MVIESTEFSLIKEIKKWVGHPSAKVLCGIGDDTAVLSFPNRSRLLATVDMMVEGVHFDLSYTIPQEIGHKALAVNLSDIASMGGRPLYALVSLGIPEKISRPFVKDMYRGMRALANRFQVELVGGNITRSPSRLLVDVTVMGEARKKTVLRSGARPGNLIAVTGNLGASAAGLQALKKLGRNALTRYPQVARAHLMPRPKIDESDALSKTKALTSMIDVSDGLASELHQVAEASGVGVRIKQTSIPLGRTTKEMGEMFRVSPLKWALEGGEDYQLLFTFKSTRADKVESALKRIGKKCYIIGEVRPKSEGMVLETDSGSAKALPSKGWDHLSQGIRLH